MALDILSAARATAENDAYARHRMNAPGSDGAAPSRPNAAGVSGWRASCATSPEEDAGLRVVRFFNTYEPVTDFYRDLIPALRAAGMPCEIVISSASYRRGRGSLSESVPAGVQVIPSGVAHADSRLKKMAVVASYTLGASLRGLFGRTHRINFFLTQPPLFSMFGPALRSVRAQSYCCLVMDLYPHVLAADGAMSESSLAFRLLRRLALDALSGADRVFAIGRCMRDRLIAEGVPSGKITVVHNWANELAITPVPHDRNPLRERYRLKGELVVLYSGNMGVAHHFDSILGVARRLRGRSDIRFLFLGDGFRRNEVERARRDGQLDNITVDGLQPSELLAYSQSLGDIHFVCLRPQFTGLMVPSKAYSALAAGRPILYEGAAEGEIARMVSEENIGAAVPLGDVDAMTSFVVNMADDRDRCARLGARARALAVGRFGRQASLDLYCDHLSRLADRSAAPPALSTS
jgi:glycosyltransferase involved in cell wall biosynthesis